jgi:pentatricopeptide repeat protein
VRFRDAPEEDAVLWTTMVSGYMDAGNMQKAIQFANEELGFVECGVCWLCEEFEDALRVFKTVVRDTNVQPNESTLSSVLLGCSSLSALGFGRQIYQWCMKLPLGRRVTVCTPFVSVYCKCGDLEGACKLFSDQHGMDGNLSNCSRR